MKNKKLFAILTLVCFMFALMPVAVFAEETTADTVTEIKTVDDLKAFAAAVNAGDTYAGKTVVLANDIEVNDYWYDNETSVDCRITKDFAGTFDGQGYTIKGLKFQNTNISTDPQMYLFSSISGTVKNLTLDGVDADINDRDNFGFIAYKLTGTAENCHVKNVTVDVAVNANGTGYMYASGAMFGQIVSATVTGCTASDVKFIPTGTDNSDLVGALIGTSSGAAETETTEETRSTIKNCAVTDFTLDATRKTKRTGGFIGQTDYTDVTNCTASNITFEIDNYGQTVGGFVGAASTSSTFEECKVENFKLSIIDENAKYPADAGGFCAYASGASFTRCSVTELDMNLVCNDVNNLWVAGGFMGYAAGAVEIENCFVEGSIDITGIGMGHVAGGFIGSLNEKKVAVSDSTAEVDIHSINTAGGFIGGAGSDSNDSTIENYTATGIVIGTTAGGFIGTGDVNVTGDNNTPATVVITTGSGNVVVNNDNTIVVPAGSTVTVTDENGNKTTITVTDGTVKVTTDGIISVPADSIVTVTDKDKNEVEIEVNVGSATITPDGTISVEKDSSVTVTDSANNETTITVNAGSVTVNTDGTTTVGKNSTVTVTDKDGNEKTTTFANGGSITASGEITVTPSSGGGFSGTYNYPVSTPTTENSTVTLSDNNAVAGETVTATVIPDNGYGVAEVIVTDADGNVIPVTNLGGGKYSFVMPAGKVNIETICKPAITLTVGSQNANVFGKTVKNDVAPIIVDGRTMLPIRFIAEALDGTVTWNEATQTVTITKDGVKVQIIIGADYAYINGEKVKLDAPAFIDNSRTYLPVRFVSEALGATVNWDAETQQIVILK